MSDRSKEIKMRKFIPFFLVLGLSFMACVDAGGVWQGNQRNAAAAEEPGVSDKPLSLYPAYLQTPLDMPVLLEAETNPVGKKLFWSSSVPSVATVDSEGCITPVGTGETVITCTLADQPGVTATCGVLVVAEGKILLWEYPPPQMDLDAVIAEIEAVEPEAEETANPPDVSEVPWPDAWPDGFPKMEGKVAFTYGETPESQNGLMVMLKDPGIETAKKYVDALAALGFKANDYSSGDNYNVMLEGNGYNIMVVYDLNRKECVVLVKK